MFDDVLSTTVLIGVVGVLAAAGSQLAAAPAGEVARPLAGRTTPQAALAAASMPVYDLPRVVVTGNRVRDGDVLADNRDAARAGIGPK